MISLCSAMECGGGHCVRTSIKTVRRTLRTPLGVVRRVSGRGQKKTRRTESEDFRHKVAEVVAWAGRVAGPSWRKTQAGGFVSHFS